MVENETIKQAEMKRALEVTEVTDDMNTAESWSESRDGPQAVVQPMAGQCQQPSSAPHIASTQPGTASISNDPADSKAAAEASEAQGLKKQAKSIDLTITFIQVCPSRRTAL
jgi:hypothetical protein